MIEQRHLRVTLGDVTLRIHVRGCARETDRPVLLFLHYFGGSGRSWMPVMNLLARRGFCCIAPDLRGFGESSGPQCDAEAFSVEQWADDVVRLTESLQLRRFVLVGHSMGAKIALAATSGFPAGLEALVLLAPSPPTPEPMPETQRARLLRSHGDAAAMRTTLRKITARSLRPSIAAQVVEDHLRSSPEAWRAWLERGSRKDISARLHNIRIPVFVAVGAGDKIITESLVQREIIERLPLPVFLGRISDAGHLLPLEAREATASFIEHSVAGACQSKSDEPLVYVSESP